MKDEDITILPADKREAIVGLNTIEYLKKASDLLGKAPFQRVSRNPTTRNEKRGNDTFKR